MRHLAALIISFSLLLGGAAAQEEKPEERLEIKKEVYVYTSEGRRDPFLSVIEASKRAKEKEREKKKKKGLAPLEDYDLAQLTLIAIVKLRDGYIASIGLPDGKFYTISPGTPIGLHGGKVHSITDRAVVIREYLPDYRGDIRAEDTYLRLREEEEE